MGNTADPTTNPVNAPFAGFNFRAPNPGNLFDRGVDNIAVVGQGLEKETQVESVRIGFHESTYISVWIMFVLLMACVAITVWLYMKMESKESNATPKAWQVDV